MLTLALGRLAQSTPGPVRLEFTSGEVIPSVKLAINGQAPPAKGLLALVPLTEIFIAGRDGASGRFAFKQTLPVAIAGVSGARAGLAISPMNTLTLNGLAVARADIWLNSQSGAALRGRAVARGEWLIITARPVALAGQAVARAKVSLRRYGGATSETVGQQGFLRLKLRSANSPRNVLEFNPQYQEPVRHRSRVVLSVSGLAP